MNPTTDPLRIVPLDHRRPAVARQIHDVLVLAHAQEAAVLQVERFVALERSPEDVAASLEYFLGALAGATLVGVVSLAPDDEPGQIEVAALVVHPAHQRRGVGRALMREALRRGQGAVLSVAVGARNAPALALYEGLGFVAYRRGTLGPEALPLVKLRRAPDPEDGPGAAAA